MADFCYECTEKLFGDGSGNDLSGITTEAQEVQARYAHVLCEGCGPIQVDSLGHCMTADCLRKHGKSRTGA
jgi:hypothetical protein